jgi:hypothetical protein
MMPRIDMSGGITLGGAQIVFRYLKTKANGGYEPMEGRLGSFADATTMANSLDLQQLLPLPSGGSLPDTGFDIKVTFVTEGPILDCDQVTVKRAYAVSSQMKPPAADSLMPGSVDVSDLTDHDLVGLVLNRIDRETVLDKEYAVKDPTWRIYARSGTTAILIPADASPFNSGEEIWLTISASRFDVPFDYDLFPTDLILKRQAQNSQDSWALVVP